MTSDINVILQLLQRQIAPVPPAYSTVSSTNIPTDSSGLYGTGTLELHSMFPISPAQMDGRAPTQVWNHTKTHGKSLNLTSKVSLNFHEFLYFFYLLQNFDQTDLKSSKKSQESLSSGIHMTAASDDTTFMTVTPETDTHKGLTLQLPQQSVESSLTANSRLRENLRYPSLPVNLDATSGRAEIQKHFSEPVLPVT